MFQREINNFKSIFVHQKSSVQKIVTIFKTKIDSQKNIQQLDKCISYQHTFHPHIIKIKFQDLIMTVQTQYFCKYTNSNLTKTIDLFQYMLSSIFWTKKL